MRFSYTSTRCSSTLCLCLLSRPKFTVYDTKTRSGREESGVSGEVEADPYGASPGLAQETQPAREAGKARATALQKARRRCIGKTGLTPLLLFTKGLCPPLRLCFCCTRCHSVRKCEGLFGIYNCYLYLRTEYPRGPYTSGQIPKWSLRFRTE